MKQERYIRRNDKIEFMEKFLEIKLGITRIYLLKTSSGYIQIDTGMKSTADKYFKQLELLKIKPQDIQLIIASHVQSDHIGSLRILKEATSAKVLVHRLDGEALTSGKQENVYPVTLMGKILSKLTPDSMYVYDSVEPDIVIENDFSLSDFGINARVIHTPGPTMGSVSVIDDEGNAFIGCVAQNFPLRFFPGIPANAVDLSCVYSSWEKLVNEGVHTLHISHGRSFNIRHLKRILKRKK
ncbi:MAG: MBL fold metallo-hydrolase [Candidatus Heimdallarchaeota archaeon]|nr:MBL fold metallo-hydrolase [Candidatus Heimdallarchaeota archaeon]